MRRCRRQIQIASIILNRIDVGERQRQIANRLIRHLRQRLRHHFRAGELRRLGVLALCEQTPHFGKRVLRFRVHRIVWPAGPQGVFVQLQPLVHDATEDHRPEAAVAHRKCAHPLRCGRLTALPRRAHWQQRVIGRWCSIPQTECRRWRRSFTGQAG